MDLSMRRDMDTLILTPLPPLVLGCCFADGQEVLRKAGFALFKKTLVCQPDVYPFVTFDVAKGYPEAEPPYTRDPAFPYRAQVSRLFLDEFGDTPVASRGRFTEFVEPWIELRTGVRLGSIEEPARTRRIATGLAPDPHLLNSVTVKRVLGTKTYYDPTREARPIADYKIGENLYDDCNEESGTAGVPSAFIFKGKRSGEPIMHCFACNNTYFIERTYHPLMYEFKEELFGVGHLIIDPLMLSRSATVVIDAPCGAGKTYNVSNWLKAVSAAI
jgi:hypothetical protein